MRWLRLCGTLFAIVTSAMTAASVRRRLAAGAIDTVIVIALMAAAFTALIVIYSGRDDEPFEASWLKRLQKLQRLGAVGQGLSVAGAILVRNRRSPGSRIAGIRAVERGDGGPVSVRSAAIRQATSNAVKTLGRELARPAERRRRERIQALHSKMHDVGLDDPAIRRQVAEHGTAANASCLRAIAPAVCLTIASELPALWLPTHQTLAELLAGIVVVED